MAKNEKESRRRKDNQAFRIMAFRIEFRVDVMTLLVTATY